MGDLDDFFIAYQDHAAPLLDVYEQAIYLYIARHTLLNGNPEAVIGFKSARKKMAFGVGQKGTPPSEGVIYTKLKSLAHKGFIEILSSERTGTRIRLKTPFEIEGLIKPLPDISEMSLDNADFFETSENRKLILDRDEHRCFYCRKDVDDNSYVIEHVISRPEGDNSFRNLVASCRTCNNRKDTSLAEDYLRLIYREGLLSQNELHDRLLQLDRLKRGELKPHWQASAQSMP